MRPIRLSANDPCLTPSQMTGRAEPARPATLSRVHKHPGRVRLMGKEGAINARPGRHTGVQARMSLSPSRLDIKQETRTNCLGRLTRQRTNPHRSGRATTGGCRGSQGIARGVCLPVNQSPESSAVYSEQIFVSVGPACHALSTLVMVPILTAPPPQDSGLL